MPLGNPLKYKGRLYVGPTGVKEFAEEMREAGIKVTIEGTAHIHFTDVEADYSIDVAQKLIDAMTAKHGPAPYGNRSWILKSVSDVREISTWG